MAKNYFNRYVWLIDTIRKHGYITFSDISDLWRDSAPTVNSFPKASEKGFSIVMKSEYTLEAIPKPVESEEQKEEKLKLQREKQLAMTGPRIAPSKRDFENSEPAFFEVLEEYRPDLVIAWGSRLYNNLPHGGRQGTDFRGPDGRWIETWKYYLKDGSEVTVLPIMHPAAAFSPEYWNRVIGLAL